MQKLQALANRIPNFNLLSTEYPAFEEWWVWQQDSATPSVSAAREKFSAGGPDPRASLVWELK